MKSVVDDVIAFCRMFAVFERDQICCGSVTPSQCVLLQTLREGDWDVSTLASHTNVTKGAMTRLIDGLVRRGFVARNRAEDDGRRVWISLTASGQTEAKRLEQLTETSIATIMSRIPEEERDQVMRSIHLLRQATEETRSMLDCC